MPDQRTSAWRAIPAAPTSSATRSTDQFQLDAFGETLLLLAAAAEHDHLDADGWRAAEVAAAAIAQRWREPDAGIWELDPPRDWTHSRLICAAGPARDRRARTGRRAGEPLARRWPTRSSPTPAAAPCTRSGRWQRAPDDPRVDAALLLAGLRGAVAGR